MEVVYLNSGDASVIEAQVYTLLEYLKDDMKLEELVLLQGFKNKREKIILQDKLKNYHFSVIWFRAWPNYTWFDIFNILSLKLTLKEFRNKKNIIIHVRGDKFGALVKKALNRANTNLLVDIRGAISEEVTRYSNLSLVRKKNKIRSAQKSYEILRSDTFITVVSQSLKEYLINEQAFNPKYVSIHPNIAGSQFHFDRGKRKILREKLGINSDEIIAICSNSNLPWQKDSDTIERLLQMNIRIINLSSKRIEFPGVINKKIPFADVPGYLSAADIAILWREKNVINKVASPSKLSEFACNGLWIIHNGTVDIACDYINKTQFGIITQDQNSLTYEELAKARKIDRIAASITGQNFFGVQTIAKSYICLYEQIELNT